MLRPSSTLTSKTALPTRDVLIRLTLGSNRRRPVFMQAAKTEGASASDLYNTFREHQREVPKLTIPELARTLVQHSTTAVMSVVSAAEKSESYPMVSIMPYVADDDGMPIMTISDLAVHSKSMKQNGRISLMVSEDAQLLIQDQRVTLMGKVEMMETGTERIREKYLKQFPDAFWVDFGDFHWFKMMEIVEARYLVGSASNPRFGTVSAEEYLKTIPDPIAPFSRRASEHMNNDHRGDVAAMVEAETGFEVDSAEIKRIDRLGMDIYCSKTGLISFTCRVAFPSPAEERADIRAHVKALTRRAHEKTNNKYLKPESH